MWFPCKNTREMFASSVFTIVFPDFQFLFCQIAETISDSILRMTKKWIGLALVRPANQKSRVDIDARMLLERNSEPQESKVNHALSVKVPGTSLHSDSAFLGNQIEWRGTIIEPNWIAFSVSLSFTTGSRLKWCFLPRLMMQTSSWSMQLWTSLQDAVLSIGWIPWLVYTIHVLSACAHLLCHQYFWHIFLSHCHAPVIV